MISASKKSTMNRANPIVLNFHESLLRTSDIELLEGPHWLNDSIISFFFEYLERLKFSKATNILFVSPEVTQCIKITPSPEIGVFLDPLGANSKDFVFLALNDNEQTEHSGGSHWSLLVISQPEQTAFHFDSSKGANQDQAFFLSKKLVNFLGINPTSGVVDGQCLQQRNGYDCGIHLLCNAELLAEYVAKFGKINGCPLMQSGYEYIQSARSRVLNLVYTLKNR